jgi:High-temperature-induced dauer-formation protein
MQKWVLHQRIGASPSAAQLLPAPQLTNSQLVQLPSKDVLLSPKYGHESVLPSSDIHGQILHQSLQMQHAHNLLSTQQYQNLFLMYLSELKHNKDFQLLINTFTRLMANLIAATNTCLPYSMKQLEWPHHILMFFWYMIEENKVLS